MARTPTDPTKAQVWVDNTDPLNPKFEFYFPRGAKGEPGGFTAATDLGSNDLNSVLTAGLYRVTQGALVSTALNYPVNVNATAVMQVYMVSATNVVQQIEFTIGTWAVRGFWQRSTSNSGVTWTAWRFYGSQRMDGTAGRALYVWDESNLREQLVYGDTGWRSMPLPSHMSSGSWVIRRVGYVVDIRVNVGTPTAAAADSQAFPILNTNDIPTGFRTPASVFCAGFGRLGTLNRRQPVAASITTTGGMTLERDETNSDGSSVTTSAVFYIQHSYTTTDPWPTILPGTASGGIPYL